MIHARGMLLARRSESVTLCRSPSQKNPSKQNFLLANRELEIYQSTQGLYKRMRMTTKFVQRHYILVIVIDRLQGSI